MRIKLGETFQKKSGEIKLRSRKKKIVLEKIDDFKDILATPDDKEKLTCNECNFTMLQNQALKSYNIKVIDMKAMISVNNVNIKHHIK